MHPTQANSLSQLEKIIPQYGIMESIASHLKPIDLFSLSQTSRTAQSAIRPNKSCWNNLTAKNEVCDGWGWKYRMGVDYGHVTEATVTKPCHECGGAVCDECRSHLTFSKLLSRRRDPVSATFHYVSRYTYLTKVLRGLHRADHNPRNITLGPSAPAHDVDPNSLTTYSYSTRSAPWRISVAIGLLDLSEINLGKFDLLGRPFNELANNRKRYMCLDCSQEGGSTGQHNAGPVVVKGITDGAPVCSCTLKNRFLSRWACLQCVRKEFVRDKVYDTENPSADSDRCWTNPLHRDHWQCACGQSFRGHTNLMVFCGWCGGEVEGRRMMA
jgi:hypothetical protein